MKPWLVFALAASACTAPGVGHEQTLEPSAETSSPGQLLRDALVGEWRVAGIDGAALDEISGIALTADGGEIWWEPRCAGAILPYETDGSLFAVSEPPTRKPPATDGTPVLPPPVCAIGLPPRLSDVMNALRAGERIERTPENGLRIFGNGRSVTLFSQ